MNNAKYHILQIIRPVAGGMRKYLLELLAYSDRQTFHHTVFGPRDPKLSSEIEGMGFDYVSADYQRLGQRVYQLRSLIRSHKPFLLHAHGYKAALLSQLAAWGMDTPKIGTYHNELSEREMFIYRLAQRFVPPLDLLIAVSRPIETLLIPLGPQKVRSLLWGVAPQPHRQRPANDQKQFLLASRMLQGKGIDTLLSALKLLEQTDPPPYLLNLAGDGPALCTYQRLGTSLDLDHRLRWLGFVKDMSVLWESVDLVILPSHREGLPLTLLEAMSFGLPIIATHVGGIPQALDFGRCGTLVPPGDPRSLCGAISQFLTDPGPFWLRAEQAQKRQQKEFNVLLAVKAQEDIYNELLR